MASTTHRANILNPAFTRFGIGTVKTAAGQLWTTQVFTRPLGAEPAATPTTATPTTKKAATGAPTAATTAPTAAGATTGTPATGSSAITTAPAGPTTVAGTPAESSPASGGQLGGSDPTSSPDGVALAADGASSSRQQGTPVPLLAGAGLLGLLVLGGAAFLLCRRIAA